MKICFEIQLQLVALKTEIFRSALKSNFMKNDLALFNALLSILGHAKVFEVHSSAVWRQVYLLYLMP